MANVIKFTHKGNFSKTESFFNRARKISYKSILEKYGQAGVDALAAATPVSTGLTASSWSYEIVEGDGSSTIYWNNSNVQSGVLIAVILQYGHGTKNGGFVQGRDYINPAMQKVFESIASDAWKEVSRQ
jgi:hypothetical protein